jgi:hypothetical protein
VCDCSILWFLEIIKSDSDERDRIVDLDNVTCDTPERLRFEKISELNQDDICPSSTTTEPTTGYKTDYTPTSAGTNASNRTLSVHFVLKLFKK